MNASTCSYGEDFGLPDKPVRTIETRDLTTRVAKLHLTTVRLIIEKDTRFRHVLGFMDLVDIATVSNCVEKAGVPTRRVSKSRLRVANKFTATFARRVEPG
jgi:hypothetical protein